ncbi:LPA [Branchiostoma lanceolatum]|uniref:LPA protein n=1 Tax=Branchiostoma lanceolatum TaxID=7740 RepID=A0A8J9VJL4_BRALA|nr:LPA [Branchiostoma lanceolatum]
MDYWRVLALFLIISVTSIDVCSSSSTTQNGDIGEDDSLIQQSAADRNSHGQKHYSQSFQSKRAEDSNAGECLEEDGASYRGKVSETRTGKTCQRWDSQTPHRHSRTPANYPSSGLEQNYCRNPDSWSGVWCYTTDPGTRWELCDVPVCGMLRLNFAGRFLADVATANNDAGNFNISTFDPQQNPSWNPKGSGDFRLVNCKVTQVCLEDGRCVRDDPIVGQPIIDSNSTHAGKLVDVDERNQEQSQIWGLVVGVDGFFKGDFVPRSFNHMHDACEGSDCKTVYTSTRFSAVWLSTLQNVWIDMNKAGQSSFIQQVMSRRRLPGFELYVKLSVRNNIADPKSPDFLHGRVVGTIYAVLDPETDPLPYGPYKRMLWAEAGYDGRGHVPFYVDVLMKSVVLDFANSMRFDIKGNVVEPSGGRLYLLQYNGTITGCEPLNSKSSNLGEIELGGNHWFQRTVGIIELSVKDTTIETIKNTPLAVIQQTSPTQCKTVLAERQDGLFVEAIDNRVMRKEPNSGWDMRFRAFQFGRSVDGIYIETSQTSPADDLNPAIQIISTEPSGNNGISTITFRSSDPGDPRRETQQDGQEYRYRIKAKKGADGISFDVKDLMLSIHLYSDYTFTPGKVTWHEHVYPIFQQYANLYPTMKPIIDLASYEDVTRKIELLKHTLTLPDTHPNHMPVTRDLSPQKRRMILSWLDNLHPSSNLPILGTTTQTLDELKRTLQVALQLELTTIPPYLSALFSIKDVDNREVAVLIKSVVIDEMKHMALVSNVLNAIGGAPDLKNRVTVPSYPAALPGGANPGLRVKLARCSLNQIRTVFQGIERPDCKIANSEVFQFLRQHRKILIAYRNTDNGSFVKNCAEIAKLCNKNTTRPQTIGAIYIHQILCPMVILEIEAKKKRSTLFTGDRTKQITSDQWLGYKESPPFAVTDLRSAVAAIEDIATEGEGSDPCDPFDERDELSHFFKFAEVVQGRRLIQQDPNVTSAGQCFDDFLPCDENIKCDKTFSFAGRLVPFFEDGVWPTISNPYTKSYPQESQARKYSNHFNKIYTGLLKCIHDAFNGHPEKMKVDCMGMMSSLTVWGKRLAQTPIDPNGDPEKGPNAAPTFEFHDPTDKDTM